LLASLTNHEASTACLRRFVEVAEMAGYLKDGNMKSKQDIVVNIETFPETLLKPFSGEHLGKLVLQVAEA
jgi:NADPH-dependent curcumin reductase